MGATGADGERGGGRGSPVQWAAVAATLVAALIGAWVVFATAGGSTDEADQGDDRGGAGQTTATPDAEPTDEEPTPSDPPDPGSSRQPAGTGDEDEVLRSGEGVRVAAGVGLDLDSSAANWKALKYPPPGGYDLILDDTSTGGIRAPYQLVRTEGEPAARRTCDDSAALVNRVARDEVRSDGTACIRTSEGRWAWIRVVEYSQSPQQEITLDITVWKQPATSAR